MDKKIIEKLKEKLESQKKSLEDELKSFAKEDGNLKHNWTAKYPNREDGDKDEEGDEVQEYDNLVSMEHNLELRLRDVSIALEKISAKGGYGICEKCGKEIEEDRLEAVPEARTHLGCK